MEKISEINKIGDKTEHPCPIFINEKTSMLVVGTIPPYRFCKNSSEKLQEHDIEFYYGSKDNYFWKIMSEAFTEENLSNQENIKNFSKKNGIGFADIIQSCKRINNNSSDNDLCDLILNYSIKEELIKHPMVTKLIYTSEFVKKLINHSINDTKYHESIDKNPKHCSIKINSKKYEVYILPSPSPRNNEQDNDETIKDTYKVIFRS